MAETLAEAFTEFFTKAFEYLDEPNEELDEDEVKSDGNGDEIIAEEYVPDFDDDEFYHQMHAHPHDDFNYQYFA